MDDERTSGWRSGLSGLAWLLLGSASFAFFLQGVLSVPLAAHAWMSDALWRSLLAVLGSPSGLATQRSGVDIPFLPIWAGCTAVLGILWVAGSALASRVWPRPLPAVLRSTGATAAVTGLAAGAIETLRLAAPASVAPWIAATSHLSFSLLFAGFLAGLVRNAGCSSPRAVLKSDRPAWAVISLAVAAYVAVFTWMNWQLYANLLLPHGDSAMYEEHLWNVSHGKGFRSYLDQGLFLGEHIQVVHLVLLPLHWIWPSHRLLELMESVALGASAVPIFLIARRHTGWPLLSAGLAVAWLLYFPLHYLDISIDFKTFRPICFGVPAVLFGIDQWERGRLRTAALLFVFALSAKEDFALVIAPLMVYFALTAKVRRERVLAWSGGGVTVAWLLLAVLLIIPAFRAGETVHYSRYFGALGASPAEIVATAIHEPGRVLSRLLSARSLMYAVLLLLPAGFLPVVAWRRLLVAGPVFAMLCLLELSPLDVGGAEVPSEQMLVPFHHFHATLLPVLWWAAAAGLGRIALARSECAARVAVAFALSCSLVTGAFYSMSPLGITFYDPGARFYWRSCYVVSERARMLQAVLQVIPETARVASTDFVHPRFTHYERSYDYSGYRPRVPADTEYIVIDAKHPWPGYCLARDISGVREMQAAGGDWEEVPVSTKGYFIVLRRKSVRADAPSAKGTAAP